MQALEKIGVLEQDEEKGGRRITQSGQRDLGKSSSHKILLLRRPVAKSISAALGFFSYYAPPCSQERHVRISSSVDLLWIQQC